MTRSKWILDNLANNWNWIVSGVFLVILGFIIRRASNYQLIEPTFFILLSSGILIIVASILAPPKRVRSATPKTAHATIDISLGSPEIIRALHKDLSEDKREYDRLIFAIPSVASAIDGIFLGIAYGYIAEPLPRLILLLTAILFTSVIAIANIKHRYFSDIVTENLMILEHGLRWPIQRVTTPERMLKIIEDSSPNLRIEMKRPNMIERVSAHKAVRNCMIFVLGILFVLAFSELSSMVGPIW